MWPRRFLAYLLLSAGVVFLVARFPQQIELESTRSQLLVESADPPFNASSASEQLDGEFVQFNAESLAATPAILDSVLSLMGETGSRCVPAVEWQQMLEQLSITDDNQLVFAFRDDLHRLSELETIDNGDAPAQICFTATLVGAFTDPSANPVDRLDATDFAGFPMIKTTLEDLAKRPPPMTSATEIPPPTWKSFQRKVVDSDEINPRFVAFGRLWQGWTVETPSTQTVDLPWLRPTTRVGGGLLLMTGLALLVSSSHTRSKRPGIRVSPVWLAVFCDVVAICGGLFLVGASIDAFWVGLLKQDSLIGLTPEWPSTTPITGIHFVAVLFLVVVYPPLTLWLASLSSQRITIDEEGITSHGALFSSSIPWPTLDSIEVAEQSNPFAFTVIDARPLQRTLELVGNDTRIVINEPALVRTKTALIEAMHTHAPAEKMKLVSEIGREW